MTAKTTSAKSTLGFGFYSVSEAARILQCSPRLVRRWTSEKTGVVARKFSGSSGVLSFAELIELYFVKMFRNEGLSLQAIRKAAEKAAAKYNSNYPFSMRRFDTDGKSLFVTLVNEETNTELLEELQSGQRAFDPIIRPFFRKLDYEGRFEPARFWPMEKKGGVVLDPLRQFGRPIIARCGVPTSAIVDALAAGNGQSRKEVADWFEIDLKDVEAAIAFERKLAA